MRTNKELAVKKKGVNKLVLGFAAVAASAIVGTTGLAAASTPGSGYGNTNNGDINLNIINSNNNIINIVINIFRS